MKEFRGVLLALLSSLSLNSLATGVDQPPITVFAAASLSNVLQELGDGFTKETSSR